MAFKNPMAEIAAREQQLFQAVSAVLSSNQIGNWGSDHIQESKAFQGWTYMAIAAIGRQAASAVPSVYAKGGSNAVNMRKSLKSKHKGLWKSFATEGAADTLPEDHWVSTLVNQPNKDQSPELFQWEFIQQMHLHGCCLIFNHPGKLYDRTVARYVIPLALTQPVYPGMDPAAPNGGVRIIPSAAGLGWLLNPVLRRLSGCVLPIEYMSIIKYPDPVLRGDGKSPTDASGWWVDSALMVDMARWKQMKRGPRPHGVVTVKGDGTTPVTDTTLDAIEKRLNRKLGDEQYDERVIAVGDGTVVPSETPPREMDYTQAFDQFGKVILAIHGTGKAAVGLTDNMTHGSISAALSQSGMVVQSDLDMLAGDFTMLAKSHGEEVEVQYEVPTYDDPALAEARLQTDLQAGIRTGREWRSLRGLPPYGDWRDDARVTPGGFVVDKQPADAAVPGFTNGGAAMDAAANTPAGSPEGVSRGGGIATHKPFQLVDNGVPEPGAKSWAKAYRKPSFQLNHDSPIVAIDLDGTLAEEDLEFDHDSIGLPIQEKVDQVRLLKDAGCQIVIFTCRDNDGMVMAWLEYYGIPWDAINASPPGFDGSGKVLANVYWDNRAVNADSCLRELVDRLPDGLVKERLQAVTEPKVNKKLGCVMLEIPAGAVGLVADEQTMICAESLRGDGLEEWPHVTVLYGIVGVTQREVIEAVRRIDQLDITFGQVSTFDKEDGTAVLKVEVESYPLRKANAMLKDALPVMETFPDYNPHLTLGIVDGCSPEALNAPYACGLNGRSVHITHAVVSINGEKYRVPLRMRSGSEQAISSIRFDQAGGGSDYGERLATQRQRRDPLGISTQPVDR